MDVDESWFYMIMELLIKNYLWWSCDILDWNWYVRIIREWITWCWIYIYGGIVVWVERWMNENNVIELWLLALEHESCDNDCYEYL
jgi:hypothetical protein